jgi:hypothetical protein
MAKSMRKSSTAKAKGAPLVKRSPSKDRVTAKSGEPKAGSRRETPVAGSETAREFPDAVYQDNRRS